ncbi:hypothetical protein Hanom_Chr16g01481061 [Helianthus anomalus]
MTGTNLPSTIGLCGYGKNADVAGGLVKVLICCSNLSFSAFSFCFSSLSSVFSTYKTYISN